MPLGSFDSKTDVVGLERRGIPFRVRVKRCTTPLKRNADAQFRFITPVVWFETNSTSPFTSGTVYNILNENTTT